MYAFYYLRPVGRIDEAIVETQHALSLDPLSILFRVHLGFLYYLQRKYEHSIAQFRKVLEMNPRYYLAHAMMGTVYIAAGQFDEALACYAKAREADANSKFVDSLEAMTLADGRPAREGRRAARMTSRAARPRLYFAGQHRLYLHRAGRSRRRLRASRPGHS